jgi:anti-anti-sigma factor
MTMGADTVGHRPPARQRPKKESTMKDFQVTVETLDEAVIVHVVGSVDSDTASLLQKPLLQPAEQPSHFLQLDLARVSYMSSAGLGVRLLADSVSISSGR